MRRMIDKLGGRKVLMGVGLILLGVVIDATFGLSTNMLYLIMAVSTGFFLGNGMEHIAKKGRIDLEEPVQVSNPNSELLDSLNSQIGAIADGIANTNRALTTILSAAQKPSRQEPRPGVSSNNEATPVQARPNKSMPDFSDLE